MTPAPTATGASSPGTAGRIAELSYFFPAHNEEANQIGRAHV